MSEKCIQNLDRVVLDTMQSQKIISYINFKSKLQQNILEFQTR